MQRRDFITMIAVGIAVALAPSATLHADGGGTVQAPATAASTQLLPDTIIIPIDAVSIYFPEIVTTASTGLDQTAVGKPVATRAVIYTSVDGMQKVTISVGQYATAGEASATYQDAVRASEIVPGSSALAPPGLGEQSFAGTVAMGAETHVGVGAQVGRLIVAATIAGYDATPDNVANVFALAAEETDLAQNSPAGS